MITVPQHPAYKDSVTAAVRAFWLGPKEGRPASDKDLIVREIYRIANDDSAPLSVVLGVDARQVVSTSAAQMLADLDKSREYGQDLGYQ